MTADKIIELTPFRADLTRALALRGERLLASTDLAEDVEALEPLEAYYIIKEIGLGQSLPILLELSHEQLEACVDLDCWNRHDFAADTLAEWLTAFSLASPETMAQSFFSLDYVVQLLFMAKTVIVYDPDTDQVPPEEEDQKSKRAMTPDGFYLLEFKDEIPLKLHPFILLDAMYQYDPIGTHQLLSEVRVDLQTQIEEEALRFRNGRMQDLGFVTPDEAATLFSRPAKGQPLPRPHQPMECAPSRVPSLYASPLIEISLLQQALSLINDQDFLSRLEQEIVWAINSAIIGYGEKTNDTKQITDIAGRVRDTISLGMEALLVKKEPECELDSPAAAVKASELLDVWCIADLFRHGFAAIMGLKKEVRQAMADPIFRTWYELAGSEQSDETGDRMERAFVAALLGLHPLQSGFDLAKPEAVKAFACLDEINIAHVRLKRLVAQICSQA